MTRGLRRYVLKRQMGTATPPPKAEMLQQVLEDVLPSDPQGYTVSGLCVAVHEVAPSEIKVMREMGIKASPPGGLVRLPLSCSDCFWDKTVVLLWRGEGRECKHRECKHSVVAPCRRACVKQQATGRRSDDLRMCATVITAYGLGGPSAADCEF